MFLVNCKCFFIILMWTYNTVNEKVISFCIQNRCQLFGISCFSRPRLFVHNNKCFSGQGISCIRTVKYLIQIANAAGIPNEQ